MLCFASNQRRHLRILYDGLGALVDAVGIEVNQVQHLMNSSFACSFDYKMNFFNGFLIQF
jgi:hypothetical protein